MYILGVAGGLNPIHSNEYGYGINAYHDASCVLLEDGEVVCGIEEERLNRIKHSNKFPVEAIKFCLAYRGITLNDLDILAINVSTDAATPTAKPGEFCAGLFMREFGVAIDPGKFRFTHHHYSHAMSAYACSGFTDALIATFDGQGEYLSSMIFQPTEHGLELLASRPINDSLGFFYLWVTEFLGFKHFDEYKVMGLAPYGNPAVYRDIFSALYQLLPEGSYTLNYADEFHLKKILSEICPARLPQEPMTQMHTDIAASLQEAIEVPIFHALRYWQKQTGERNLCLAGGVAHNCVANGKIARSGLFDAMFVQPASHDAGGGLGSALHAYKTITGGFRNTKTLKSVFWGSDIPAADAIETRLADWQSFINFEKRSDICADTATLLTDDKVVGWVQGRSEFGPRALGSRSILADPRPAGNKDRINAMVKKREGFRPFAPAVQSEQAETYFEVCASTHQYDFMTYTVYVRPEKRELLGAITHVNGTARIQTVNRETNGKFWNLLAEFDKLTGTPVLLNTSFNNNAEPIVETVDDAVTCFLTTGLDALVVGDFLITKKSVSEGEYAGLLVSMRRFESVRRTLSYNPSNGWAPEYAIHVSYDESRKCNISDRMFNMLTQCMALPETSDTHAPGSWTLGELMASTGVTDPVTATAVTDEMIALWGKRLVVLLPTPS